MASGHVNRTQQAEHMAAPTSVQREDFPCQPGAVHTWHLAAVDRISTKGWKAAIRSSRLNELRRQIIARLFQLKNSWVQHWVSDAEAATAQGQNSRLIRPANANGCELPGVAPGVGRDRVTSWLFFSSVIVRKSTERKYQPMAASPTWRRIKLFVVWLRMSARFCGLPIAVPTSVKGGRSGSAGGGGASATGMGGGANGAGGAGGRRDAEKSGRSCVTESELTGIPHNGLPPGGGCRRSGFFAAARCCSVVGPAGSARFLRRLAPAGSWPMAPFTEKEAIAATT